MGKGRTRPSAAIFPFPIMKAARVQEAPGNICLKEAHFRHGPGRGFLPELPGIRLPFNVCSRKQRGLPDAGLHQSIFSLKRCALQTIRPVVSRKKRIFPLTFGRAALCRRLAFTFFKGKRSKTRKGEGDRTPPLHVRISFRHCRALNGVQGLATRLPDVFVWRRCRGKAALCR